MKDRTIMNSIDYTGDEDVFFLAYHIIRVNEEKGRYGLSAMKDTAESFIRQYTNDNNGSTVNNIIDNFKNTLDFINVCIAFLHSLAALITSKVNLRLRIC